MLFKSNPLKAVIHKRKTIKFDVNGEYETKDKGEIETLAGAVGVTDTKKAKAE